MRIKQLIYCLFMFLLIVASCAVNAKSLPEHTKNYTDFSGVYDCTGDDALKGKHISTVTMTLKPEHSKGAQASYDFVLAVPDGGVYHGHAAANGNVAAMHFALPQEGGLYGGKTQEFGTGIAKFKINAAGKLSFHQFYFEPLFKGGNTGVEDCVKRD